MKTALILGTARSECESKKVLQFFESYMDEHNFEYTKVEVADWGVQRTGQESQNKDKITGVMSTADAYLVISPEYNGGYPGELKLFLDSFYMEYVAKPIGFVGVSSGNTGGARAIEQLKLVSLKANLIPIHNHLYVPYVEEFNPSNERLLNGTKEFLQELTIYAQGLKELQGLLRT